jgi:hypothetical protein
MADESKVTMHVMTDETGQEILDQLKKVTAVAGPQGEKGDKGDAAATISVGSVTTLDAGSEATVTNSGTSSEAVFDFGIPTGAKGEKGDKGETGDVGEKGEIGPQGETGTAATISVGSVTTLDAGSEATVTNSGTSSEAVFDFGIPTGATGAKGDKGDVGDKGDKGDAGPAATVTVGTITELAAGSTPTVINSGSDSAAVLDFGFPATNVSARALTLNLPASGWTNKAQTIQADGVSTESTIIVTYAPASKSLWQQANISASSQADGTLTFVCDYTPTEDITANALVMSVVA